MKKNQNRHLHSGCGESLQSNLVVKARGTGKGISNKDSSRVSNTGSGWGHLADILGDKEKNPNG